MDVSFDEHRSAYVCKGCCHEFTLDTGHKPLRIFISYGHKEHAELAERLNQDLLSRGHSTWYDKKDLKTGKDWELFIEKGIDYVSADPQNGRVVLLMTPHAVRRPDGYCLNELARALSRQLSIIPVMVVWCEPPLSICRIQWLDMQDCVPLEQKIQQYDARVEQLIEAIEQNRLDCEGAQARLMSMLKPLPFDADINMHIARFTGREWLLKSIDRWLSDPKGSRIYVISGGPGVGKTAIAAWLCHYKKEVSAFHLCVHNHEFKSDPRRCVLSIAYQLSSQLPDYRDRLNGLDLEEIARASNARTLFDMLILQPLSANFPRPGRNVVILIDALDEATHGNTNEIAGLLASELPKAPDWLRAIVTCRPEKEVMVALQGIEPHPLDMRMPENIADIRSYLARELKRFFPDEAVPLETIDYLAQKSEGLFLYVDWIRQELDAGRLSLDHLDQFPAGLGTIYTEFFTRQFPENVPGRPGLSFYESDCRPALELVIAARDTLDLALIGRILGWDPYKKKKVIAAFGSLLQPAGAGVRPFHRTLVEWLTNEEAAGNYYVHEGSGHERMAEFGWNEYLGGIKSMSAYSISHLPHHLLKAGRFADMARLWSDPEYFVDRWDSNEFDVMMMWVTMEAGSPLRKLDVYRDIISSPRKYPDNYVARIAQLLNETGHIELSIGLRMYLVEKYRQADDNHKLQEVLGDLAWSLYLIASLDSALELLREKERICQSTGDKLGLQISLGRQGNIYLDKNDMDKALELFRSQETICRELNNKRWLHRALGSQGTIYQKKGDSTRALELYAEKELICKELGDRNGLQIAVGNRANIYLELGRLDEAMELYREQVAICREIGHKVGMEFALGNQGVIYLKKGDYEKAFDLFGLQEKLCRELGKREGLARSLIHRAYIISTNFGRPSEALPMAEEAYKIAMDNGIVSLANYIRPLLNNIRLQNILPFKPL
jgi:tetratricopeptide (TPR) repeat protein